MQRLVGKRHLYPYLLMLLALAGGLLIAGCQPQAAPTITPAVETPTRAAPATSAPATAGPEQEASPPPSATPPPTSTPALAAQVAITSPAADSEISSGPLTVSGTGLGLFEGNVVVRVEDAAGNTLAEEATVLDITSGNMGDPGEWSVELVFDATPGESGRIVAFSTSPQDGSVVAQDEVGVTFAAASPQAATWTVEIESPQQGEILEAGQPLAISGRGQGLFEGALVVRVLDNLGNLVAEQPTLLEGTDVGAGQPGTWEVELALPAEVEAGDWLTIFAYATSPRDGSLVTADAVQARYGETARNIWITIERPAPYTQLTQTTFTVSGRGAGLFEGSLVVQAQDSDGNVLAEEPLILVGDNVGIGGEGTWSADLTVEVDGLTSGRLVAFSTSPADGSIAAEARVEVAYGEPGEGPWLVITNPLPHSHLPADAIGLSGRGGGLFEGALVVQAQDADGNVLDQAPVILEGDEVGTGGAGDWFAALAAEVPAGTPGRVVAFATSANDGSVVAFYVVEVVYE
ncbi:MAG: Gmad2 immunoglobulin-like domain-containing protein [Candidatus Promineifilaceae bacterium]